MGTHGKVASRKEVVAPNAPKDFWTHMKVAIKKEVETPKDNKSEAESSEEDSARTRC